MDFPKEVAQHLNFLRQNLTKGDVRRIPDVGFNVFNKNFEEPQGVEGFTEVISVDFKPQFDNEEHRKLFSQWTT